MGYAEIDNLLAELEALLRKQGEANWLRGVVAVRRLLLSQPDGLEKARYSYASMNRGAGSFSDYNIWIPDFEARKKENAELDRIRDQLWKAFDL